MNEALLGHRLLFRAALSASHIFAWLYILLAFATIGPIEYAVGVTALTYAVAHAFSVLLAPRAGKSIRNGTRAALERAVACYALALMILALLLANVFSLTPITISITAIAFAVIYAYYRAYYFMPYAVIGSHTYKHGYGWLVDIVTALIPAVAGFVIVATDSGPLYLLITGGALSLVSLVPLQSIDEVYERYEWSYRESWIALVLREHSRIVWSSLLDGTQAAGLFFFWPLFLFLLFRGSFIMTGVALSLTLLLTISFRHLLRKRFTSSLVWKPNTTALMLSGSWILRMAAFTPLSAALADAVYYVGTPHKVYALDPFTLEQAPDGGAYVDELSVLKEMSYGAGRAFVALMVFATTTSESLYVMFGTAVLLAAAAGLGSIYLARTERRN